MEPCQFSETQFSFCFTFEYIKQFLPTIPLPIFPNTVQEGQKGGGYDVDIAGSIFFQFKIPAYYDKVSNFFRKYWDVFCKSYYKIKIDTNQMQFRLLKDLKSSTNQVFYATPKFFDMSDLAMHYANDKIVVNSALFPIENFPSPGSDHHNLIYRPDNTFGRLFSDPIDIKIVLARHPLELFSRRERNLTIYEEAQQIRDILLKGNYMIHGDFLFNSDLPTQLVKEVYTVLLTNYDIHWYPVIYPNP